MKTFKTKIVYSLIVVWVLLIASCTQYDNPPSLNEEYQETVDTTIHKKVLMIVIEGAEGEQVKELMPATIKSLLPHSKYSFDGLSEPKSNDASTWASLMTGVFTLKHNITDQSFIGSANLNDLTVKLPFYPTVFYNIHQARPLSKTLSITSWDPLSMSLLEHADERIDVSTDAEVKDKAISKLKSTNPLLTLVSFRSALEAGKSSGFTVGDGSTPYANAITTIDGYIGEVLQALKQRQNYAKEDWLVIITSNHGGLENGVYGGVSETERRIFGIFYHPKYNELKFIPQKFLATRFKQYIRSTTADPTGIYDMNKTDLTVEAKIRINPKADGTYGYGNWNRILGKNNNTWYLARQNNNMKTYLSSGRSIEPAANNTFSDGLWHTYSTTIKNEGLGFRTIKIYVDGALAASQTESGFTYNLDTGSFFIGDNNSLDFNIAEIRIWNKVLLDYQLAETACIPSLTSSSPYFQGLISYWPGHEGTGNTMYNAIAGKPNIVTTLVSNSAGVTLADAAYTLSANNIPCSAYANNITIENISIVPQIYYWLGIPMQSTWNLDGKVFLSNFESEVVK